ncbi:hypothetical protein VM1G_00874 [Cytospora mali]|uniref:Transmembrane protein n=1 Tax=Cytospora mali TaxID=578113 RepID=A0A194VK39_CYTMA|nr:hypothetical protein VM1G_00874 [Valsa mali]
MGLPEDPTQTCATPLFDKKTDASRIEILVATFGLLFLVSQLWLIIWILAQPHAFSRKQEHRKTIDTSPSTSHSSLDGDGNGNDSETPRPRPEACRSSTWNGGSLERQYQRGKSGGLDELEELGTSLSGPETDSDSDRSIQKGIRDIGMMAAVLAMPMSAPPSRQFSISPGSPDGDSETELKEFNHRTVWMEMGLMAAAIAKPASPRSPRLNAADQAALMEALAADIDEIEAPSSTPAGIEDAGPMASGFDDPLGVKQRLASPTKADVVLSAARSELRGRSVS